MSDFSHLPGYVDGDYVSGGPDVRCGNHPAFNEGMMRGWIRARANMLRDLSTGHITPYEYRAIVATFRSRWGDEINRTVNNHGIAAFERGRATDARASAETVERALRDYADTAVRLSAVWESADSETVERLNRAYPQGWKSFDEIASETVDMASAYIDAREPTRHKVLPPVDDSPPVAGIGRVRDVLWLDVDGSTIELTVYETEDGTLIDLTGQDCNLEGILPGQYIVRPT